MRLVAATPPHRRLHNSSLLQAAVTAVQACHELVTPETLHPLLQTLVHHFVSDKSRPEMVAIGLNTAREVCMPLRNSCALVHGGSARAEVFISRPLGSL